MIDARFSHRARYREIEYDPVAFNCWHFVREVYRDVLGVELPAFGNGVDAREATEVDRAVAGALPGWRRVEAPEPGDVVLVRLEDGGWHVGVYAGDGRMLNLRPGGVRIEHIGNAYWRPKLAGYYRRV